MQPSNNATLYKDTKYSRVNLPWVIVLNNDVFAYYRTKKAAVEDARKYGLKLVVKS